MGSRNYKFKSVLNILYIFVSVSIILAFPVQIMAGNTLETIITASSSEGDAGENVTVQVSVQNPNGMAGGSFNVFYDSQIVTPGEIKAGEVLKNVSFIANPDYAKNGMTAVRIVWAGSRGINQDGILCTIVFHLNKNGSSELMVKDLSIKNGELKALDANTIDGNIKVGNGVTVPETPVPPSPGGGPAGPGGGGPMPPIVPPVVSAATSAPTTGAVTTANTTVISEQAIDKKVATAEGKMVETFTVTEEVKTEIAKAIKAGKAFVQITVAPAEQAAKTVIDIPSGVMQSSAGVGLAITTPNATLELPKGLVDTFAKAGKELAITVEKGEAAESAAQMKGVQGTEGAAVLGTPAVIHTEIKGSTSVTLPLTGIDIPTDPAARAGFLENLAIFVVHSDGDKQVIPAAIVKDASGKPIGISFIVERFSTFAIIKVAAPVITLNDIAANWAEADINKLVQLGAIKGYADGSFQPNNNITRAEFATVIVKAFKLVPQSGKVFSDTQNSWARDNISTASYYGIVNGCTDSCFGPNEQITREQMAVMIVKAANLGRTMGNTTYSDDLNISSWAKEAVAAASEENIISGYPNNTFKPKENASRAEAAAIIIRALK